MPPRRRKWSSLAETCLNLARSLELRLWHQQHPLRQFEGYVSPHGHGHWGRAGIVPPSFYVLGKFAACTHCACAAVQGPGLLGPELLSKLESRHPPLDMDSLREMSAQDIGAALRHPAAGPQVKSCVEAVPTLELSASLQPITRTVLRIQLGITATFAWRDRQHGAALRWLIWVEDPDSDRIYHHEVCRWAGSRRCVPDPLFSSCLTLHIFIATVLAAQQEDGARGRAEVGVHHTHHRPTAQPVLHQVSGGPGVWLGLHDGIPM